MICRSLIWLLATALPCGALEWRTTGHGREAMLEVPRGGKVGFTSMTPRQTGIQFTNRLTDIRGMTNQIFMSGSGVAAGDVDGDGWCDLYFCGLDSPNVLYHNLGNWKFEDTTAASGASCGNQPSTGAAFADIDGDADLDLLVTSLGAGVRLFLNDGKGKFRESTREAGLASNAGSMSMALADIDGDGDLDLYVANYRTSSLQDEVGLRFRIATTNNQRAITQIDNRPVTREELDRYALSSESNSVIENGEPDFLYRNDGHGKFSLISWTDGSFLDEHGQPIPTPLDWGLSVMFRDINSDRAPDIYVCNDSDSPDRIWINDGRGRFRALPRLSLRQICLASMGVDFADINRDGWDDFFVADMLSRQHAVRHTQMLDRRRLSVPGQFENRQQFMRNMLYLNRGDGAYAEIAQLGGVDASDWSWMPLFLDVDLDGFEDLLVTTGLERSLRDADARRQIDAAKAQRKLSKQEFLEMRRIMPRLATPNYLFRNRGDLTFEDVSAAWGFNSSQISHGMALADLDNDGDLDAAVNCMNEPALIYRNDCPAPRIAVRLKGRGANTKGIGARIHVSGGPVAQGQEMIASGRYLSCDDAMRVFAAGSNTNELTIEVAWRSGHNSTINGLKANRIYEITETGAGPIQNPKSKIQNPKPPTLFQDVSHLLKHHHVETPFNDFERQPLLPRQFSQAGPGLCWCDLNRDGWDDLVVSAARGGALGLFVNKESKSFGRLDVSAITGKAPDDQTAVLSWPSEGGATVLVGVSSYEAATPSTVARYEMWAGGVDVREPLAFPGASVGPLAVADIDGDGDLDLFVGGRLAPGRYPEAVTSRLYRNDGKAFQMAAEFPKLGLVNGAVFSDLTGDGFPELVLACDWSPLKILRNQKGQFTPWDAHGLSHMSGWWNAVNTGDFDGDGRLDIAAANWGRNTKYQYYAAQPLRIYFGDLDDNGTAEIIEAHHDPCLRKVVPWARWDSLSRELPFISERFVGFKAYSEAGVEQIFGEHKFKRLEATTLDSMVFLNRGDRFAPVPLPIETQFAPAFGTCVADFDGDGCQDIFLAQNFFAVDSTTSRYDSGRGLLLQGDGRGGFTALSAARSGIRIYGEQRGAAVADFDRDGRVDIAIAQNGSATKLYRNQGARNGLRVRLNGPSGNPTGVGGVVRDASGSEQGPAWEIHAGSGYWSQDSATIVVTSASPITKLWVRWPGGNELAYTVPAGAREVALALDGKVIATN